MSPKKVFYDKEYHFFQNLCPRSAWVSVFFTNVLNFFKLLGIENLKI